MVLVRDLRGRPLFHMEADGSARDVNGKPVAARAGSDEQNVKLADRAARWMLGDLAPTDVVQPATQAAFMQPQSDEFVADYISPVRMVKQAFGYYFAQDALDAIKLVVVPGSLDGEPQDINPTFKTTKFTCQGYALAANLPRRTIANADFDLKAFAVRRLCDGLRRSREARLAKLLTTSGNWNAANRVAATAKWNGGVNPAPLTDLFSALLQSYLPANVLVLPENAAQYFHFTGGTGAQVRDFVQGGGQLPHICYARAKWSFGTAGVTPAYMWTPGFVAGTTPANVALVRCPTTPDELSSSATFRWLGDEATEDGKRVEGFLVREYDNPGDDTCVIVLAHDDIEVQVDNRIGAVITGALA